MDEPLAGVDVPHQADWLEWVKCLTEQGAAVHNGQAHVDFPDLNALNACVELKLRQLGAFFCMSLFNATVG
jgi:hypothetical protein